VILKFNKAYSGIRTAKNRVFGFAAELELQKLDSSVWQTGHSGFVRELNTKPIQLTSRHFINKNKL
jgi:hypothetical protein